MFDWILYGQAFGVVMLMATAFWLFSLIRNDVSIVDSLWALMFLVMLAIYMWMGESVSARGWLILALVTIWAIRLSVFISIRNHGKPEDHRYQTIRENNQPNFRFKSLFIVFWLQAVLAGLIAMPLLSAASSVAPLGWLDILGVALWLFGMFFEVVGDQQLKAFRSDENNTGGVLDTGLWGLSRHPNYFGEFTLWWGFYCIAVASGGWWTIASPLLMSILLLKVSGVSLLESSIEERRPDYARYIKRTNAFFPGFFKNRS